MPTKQLALRGAAVFNWYWCNVGLIPTQVHTTWSMPSSRWVYGIEYAIASLSMPLIYWICHWVVEHAIELLSIPSSHWVCHWVVEYATESLSMSLTEVRCTCTCCCIPLVGALPWWLRYCIWGSIITHWRGGSLCIYASPFVTFGNCYFGSTLTGRLNLTE